MSSPSAASEPANPTQSASVVDRTHHQPPSSARSHQHPSSLQQLSKNHPRGATVLPPLDREMWPVREADEEEESIANLQRLEDGLGIFRPPAPPASRMRRVPPRAIPTLARSDAQSPTSFSRLMAEDRRSVEVLASFSWQTDRSRLSWAPCQTQPGHGGFVGHQAPTWPLPKHSDSDYEQSGTPAMRIFEANQSGTGARDAHREREHE